MSKIFTTIEQLKLYVKINASMPFASIDPYQDDAISRYILPYLGADLLADLEAYCTEVDEEATELAALLPIVRRALAPFLIYTATHEASINFGDTGHTVSRTTTLAPASDAKIDKFTNSLLDRGWLAIEVMIQWLETHSEDFPDWTYTAKTDFIHDAEEFQETGLVEINRSRLIFEKFRLILQGINEREIKKLLGTELYATLVNDPTTDLHTAIIQLIIKYTANQAASILTSANSGQVSQQSHAVIRAIYKDLYETGNYYADQAKFYYSELETILNDNAEELGITASTPFTHNTCHSKVFTAEG